MIIIDGGTEYQVVEYRQIKAGDVYLGIKDGEPAVMKCLSDYGVMAFILDAAGTYDKYYTQGYNAYHLGEACMLTGYAASAWRNGWNDAQDNDDPIYEYDDDF